MNYWISCVCIIIICHKTFAANEKQESNQLIKFPIKCFREECTVSISIGNQEFDLILDLTNFPRTWIITSDCKSNCFYSNKYNYITNAANLTRLKDSCDVNNASVNGISYSITGAVNENIVRIGGLDIYPYKYCAVYSSSYPLQSASGGLSLSTLIQSGHVGKIIGVEICYDVFISNCEGSVTLGGYVDSPNIIWTPYAPQSASPHNIANISTLNIEKYSVGGNKLEYSRIAAITPAFRSMQMPSNEYAITFQLFAYICNEGIIAPCQIDHPDYSLFPIMEIVIDGGGHLYLNPQDYLIITPNSSGKYTVFFYLIEGENWVLGLPLIKRYYIVFDLDNNQIGFNDNKFGEYKRPDIKKVSHADLAWFLAILFMSLFLLVQLYMMVFKQSYSH